MTIHERKRDKTLAINGPLTRCVTTVKAMLRELEPSILIQREGFRTLIVGWSASPGKLERPAPDNRSVEAREAVEPGLVPAVI